LKVLNVRNVREAYVKGLVLLSQEGVQQQSRAGDVLVLPYPLTTVYQNPCERVLVDSSRDANCFFHLAESLWMLGGRRDAMFLNRYIKDFAVRFAEANLNVHDAYGYRWRNHFQFDQLKTIIKKLRKNPDDRQAVLQMWDAANARDLTEKELKTRPCNTHAYFRVHNNRLDMTVCCRSNDAIWGAYGANVVHFSFLQEYMAAHIGVDMGVYYQISNNFHAYVDVMSELQIGGVQPYETALVPLITDVKSFDDELKQFLLWVDIGKLEHTLIDKREWKNNFFPDVAIPLLHAHALYKNRLYTSAGMAAQQIKSEDWQRAALEWLHRRHVKRQHKNYEAQRELRNA
jgi:thymidylate synthase